MVLDSGTYVIARNAAGRATLQHKVGKNNNKLTGCGADINAWSRYYTRERMEPILCRRAGCRA